MPILDLLFSGNKDEVLSETKVSEEEVLDEIDNLRSNTSTRLDAISKSPKRD